VKVRPKNYNKVARAWNKNKLIRPRRFAVVCIGVPISPLANVGRVFICHTEKRKTKREGRHVAIKAVLEDGGGGVTSE
jgi:hypothetical protein